MCYPPYEIDLTTVLTGLKSQGYVVEADQTMKDVAAANSVDPYRIYAEIYALQKK